MDELKRVEELDKLIPIAKKEFQEKQALYQKYVNERVKILSEIVACSKKRFTNAKAAKQEMKRLNKKGIGIGGVYHCERCRGWHLTSKSK